MQSAQEEEVERVNKWQWMKGGRGGGGERGKGKARVGGGKKWWETSRRGAEGEITSGRRRRKEEETKVERKAHKVEAAEGKSEGVAITSSIMYRPTCIIDQSTIYLCRLWE